MVSLGHQLTIDCWLEPLKAVFRKHAYFNQRGHLKSVLNKKHRWVGIFENYANQRKHGCRLQLLLFCCFRFTLFIYAWRRHKATEWINRVITISENSWASFRVGRNMWGISPRLKMVWRIDETQTDEEREVARWIQNESVHESLAQQYTCVCSHSSWKVSIDITK